MHWNNNLVIYEPFYDLTKFRGIYIFTLILLNN